MGYPFFSIIMVCYNDARYLPKAFEGIKNQTFHNFEFVFVINGSTDDTEDRIMDFKRENNYINTVIEHIEINKGLPNGRNHGLALAKGKYIIFHDADDWMDTDCLEQVYNVLSEHEADQIIQELKFYNEDGEIIEHLHYSSSPSRWTKNSLQGNFYRRQVFVDNCILFSDRAYYDDFFITALFNSYSDSFYVIRSAHYNMLLRHSSMTHLERNQMRPLVKKLEETFKEVKQIEKRLNHHNEYYEYEYDCIQKYYTSVYSGTILSYKDKCDLYKQYNSIMRELYPNYLNNSQVRLFRENGFLGHFKRNIWVSSVMEKMDVMIGCHFFMRMLLLAYHLLIRLRVYDEG